MLKKTSDNKIKENALSMITVCNRQNTNFKDIYNSPTFIRH